MKYYTAFIYDTVAKLHCTHKYLGSQSEQDYEAICATIDRFFAKTSAAEQSPCILFNQRDWFGPKGQIAVLRPDPSVQWEPHLFPDLRAQLDGYRPDDYGEYKPHVTTEATEIYLPFRHYAIMTGDSTVLKKWRI